MRKFLIVGLFALIIHTAWALPKTWVDKNTGITFVYIPSGCFYMGCDQKNTNCYFDEKPLRKICLKGFWISKTEITLSQWKKFLKETKYHPKTKDLWGCEDTAKPMFKQSDQDPVVCVNWYDAKALAQWMSQKTGKKVRLPTEEEWEYACKKGKSDAAVSGHNANYWSGFSGKSDRDVYRNTSAVCSFGTNKMGLCDMIGNVWEWTESWYSLPNIPSPKERKVVKGGGWESQKKILRCSARKALSPERNYDSVGFRLVIVP